MNDMVGNNEVNTTGSVWGRIIMIIISYILLVGTFQIIGMSVSGIPIEKPEVLRKLSFTQQLFLTLIITIPIVTLVFLYRKFVDKKSIVSIGFATRNVKKDMLAGFAIALAILGAGTVFILLFSQSKITFSLNNQFNLVSSIILFMLVSLSEELLFRGYILNNLLMSGKKYNALIWSSVIFALFHLLNPGITFIAFVNLFLAGMLMGSCYIFSQNLWFPISLHFFWNFFQGPILGYAVSGTESDSIFSFEAAGKNYLHGGRFGFEGSIICTVLVSLAVALILIYHSRNQVRMLPVKKPGCE